MISCIHVCLVKDAGVKMFGDFTSQMISSLWNFFVLLSAIKPPTLVINTVSSALCNFRRTTTTNKSFFGAQGLGITDFLGGPKETRGYTMASLIEFSNRKIQNDQPTINELSI
ncbi:uncharacterized protein LOC112093002 isoform X2 [Morus notabilis]|uniref:uncharacterized protein LOC112093002 isoform X2 n=1 Tax=Morus notabilis TaxID=981085 RepID=UPI000CED3D5D|nr:uncharacterized protein LOC112093002 isoform X2 [Morus notabilis]